MKIAIISYTSSGIFISNKLKKRLPGHITEYNKETFEGNIKKDMNRIFNKYNGIIFVSSIGIAIRYIAPYIENKLVDPAVIVIDDLGKNVIPILSGHIGGANDLSRTIAALLESKLILTTASDNRDIDAIDEFAKRNNLYIESMWDAKNLTYIMVEGKKIGLISNENYDIKYNNVEKHSIYEHEIELSIMKYDGIILVDYRDEIEIENKIKRLGIPHVKLIQKNINIGMGCRKNKSYEELYAFVEEVFSKNNISINSINNLGTIDIKLKEKGLIELSNRLDSKFVAFSKEELNSVENKFKKNEFVKSKVGVHSVSEASAYLLSKDILIEKVSKDGMTLAVSKEE